MKIHYLGLLSIAITVLGLASCSADAIEPTNDQEASAEVLSIDYLDVTYENQTFTHTPVMKNKKGVTMFGDEKLARLYAQKQITHPNMAVFLAEENHVIIYNTLEECLEDQQIVMPDTERATRAVVQDITPYVGSVILYDDKNWEDTSWEFRLGNVNETIQQYHLKYPYKFNDKCSSLQMYNLLKNSSTVQYIYNQNVYYGYQLDLVFIGYENKNYNGTTIVCVLGADSNVAYSSFRYFNDKMTSFKFFFTVHGAYSTQI